MDGRHGRFPRSIAALEGIFSLLHEFADATAIDGETRFALDVIVEELFTNQVRHAPEGDDEIQLSVLLADGTVTIELVDQGVHPYDPTANDVVDTNAPIEDRTPGGLGVHFVRTLSDTFEWNYDPDRRQSRITVTRQLER